MQSACVVLYFPLWLLRFYSIFPHYLINGAIFGKEVTEHKIGVLTFSITFGSVVGVATTLQVGRFWDEIPVGKGRFSAPCRPALGPTQPLMQWVPDHLLVYRDWGVALTTHPI
jgi:hypothetical protein